MHLLSRLLVSLQKMLRVNNHRIEELYLQISLINEQIDVRLREIEKNTRYINTERLIASVNITGCGTLDAFVMQRTSQNIKYASENEDLKKTMKEIQEQLFLAYSEQKKLEKIQENEQRRIDFESMRKEVIELDEIASHIYLSKLTKI